VYGLQNDAALVVPGDLYLCYPSQDMQEGAQLALARGAVAIIAERELEAPEEVPVVLVDDLVDVQQRVALAFYGGWHGTGSRQEDGWS
jgi:UDP-N-acetylmuramyl tripeptide synthase